MNTLQTVNAEGNQVHTIWQKKGNDSFLFGQSSNSFPLVQNGRFSTKMYATIHTVQTGFNAVDPHEQ